MAGAAGCVQEGDSCEVPVAEGLGGKSGTPSLHTSAKPTGRKRQRQGGGAGKGALTLCQPAWAG